ncbi:MAG: NAD(+) synthase [Chloroflexota bacterium]|nr:NAD(+) synthase [Chloroflexota bacterium]
MDDGGTIDGDALADEIADWLRARRDEAGAERFVLGLSGGVDSATVCGLCARAGGPQRVLAAIMPSHSNPTDAEHAALVAEAFGVEAVRIDLSPVTEAFLAAMPGGGEDGAGVAGEWRDEGRARLATANARPRLRMTTLYFLANLRNGVVVGTGNRSEAEIGYFTKYGDGGVDLLPIVDLYKHEVRALARTLGVPRPVIDKPPSAGLWEGQTDEAEIGLSYDQLDAALAALDAGNDDAVDPTVRERVLRMRRTSEHKRRPVPAFRRASLVGAR